MVFANTFPLALPSNPFALIFFASIFIMKDSKTILFIEMPLSCVFDLGRVYYLLAHCPKHTLSHGMFDPGGGDNNLQGPKFDDTS